MNENGIEKPVDMSMETSCFRYQSVDYRFHMVDLEKIGVQPKGNKYFKLKYNILHYLKSDYSQLVTFGGAYSNHIYATCVIAKKLDIPCVGIIRGEPGDNVNPTIQMAMDCGMRIIYVDRSRYKRRNHPDYLKEINLQFPNSLIVPEGGDNSLGLKGCIELGSMISKIMESNQLNTCLLPIGTGSTFSGVSLGLHKNQLCIGIPVLKGETFNKNLKVKVRDINAFDNWHILTDFHFGGFAKFTDELISFCNLFYEQTTIKLDPIYNAKSFYAAFILAKESAFKEKIVDLELEQILLIKTGGSQGLAGFHERYPNKLCYM